MRVRIEVDEQWPVYSFRPDIKGEVDVPPTKVERWNRVHEDYSDMQSELSALLNGTPSQKQREMDAQNELMENED